MSTLPSSPTPAPLWKQEVNRRLAEHKNRKGFSVVDSDAREESHMASNSRAAAAAARVAARYAKAPSYSDLQASEARAALRVAEAATRAALEAQAAAQAVLDQMEGRTGQVHEHERESRTEAVVPQPEWQPWETDPEPSVETPGHHSFEVRWDPDMPVLPAQQQMRAGDPHAWEVSEEPQHDFQASGIYEAVEGAQPIPANLIEFPREIIATRRMRPRITEALPDESQPQQLSIFEVDPNSVSTEPAAITTSATAEPTWIGSSWQEIQLDAQPQQLPDYYAIPPEDAPKLYQAPFGRRMMAAMVDTAVILGLTCGAVALLASKLDSLPGKHTSEICGVLLVLGFAAIYEWFFLTFAKVTPGMRYAQLSLCTFNEEFPTRDQVEGRLKAMLISVLPLGLGMLWSLFDEDQMSWHDRLSKTYLRLS